MTHNTITTHRTRCSKGRQEISKSLQIGREQALDSMNRLQLGDNVNQAAVASILIAALDGLALQQMADANFDKEAVYNTLAEMLETYVWVKNK